MPSNYDQQTSSFKNFGFYSGNNASTHDLFENHTQSDKNDTRGFSKEYNYPYYYGYEDEFYHVTFDYEIPLYGYVWPVLVLVTTLANVLVIWTFLIQKNINNSTNIILISLAVSDSFTVLATLPGSIFLYALQNDIMTGQWCNIIMILRMYISRAFHTVSVWQTVVLGIQRYLAVCFPLVSKHWCTTRKTFVSIFIIYILSVALHSYHAFDSKVTGMQCTWDIERPCSGTCVYLWCVAFTVHLLPCAVLIYLTVRIMMALRQARTTTGLQKFNRSTKFRRATLTVVIVVIIFLIPEAPNGIYFLSVVIKEHVRREPVQELLTNHGLHSAYEILMVVAIHCNFWIYCTMLHDFRQTLLQILCAVKTRLRQFRPLRTLSQTSSTYARSVQTSPNDRPSRQYSSVSSPTVTNQPRCSQCNIHIRTYFNSTTEDNCVEMEICEVPLSTIPCEREEDENDNVFIDA